ncbi:MAG: AMP-binding protein [Sphingobium sp.]
MFDQLLALARSTPDSPFIFYDDKSHDFATVAAMAQRGATWLSQQGIGKGDHVMIAVSNRPLFLYYWFSTLALGAVAVPVSHDAFGDGLRYMVDQSDCLIVLTEASEQERLAQVGGQIGVPVRGFLDEAAFEAAVKDLSPAPVVAAQAETVTAILYTSGTTGLPKGVVIPHASYRAIGEKIVQATGITASDRILTFLPMHHANPQMYSLMSCLTTGCSMVLVPRFSASRFLDQVRRHGATGFTYVGTVLNILSKQIQTEIDSSLRFCIGGGAPRGVWQELASRLGITVHELYGMTETGGMATMNTLERSRFGSVGCRRDDFDVEVMDDHDTVLPVGMTGEIVVRPRKPHVMTSGYYRKAEETLQALSNFWFHTGDLGRFDEDGFLYFEGRKKELIRRAGEMISPVTIELCALKHAAIADCAAVGVPDPVMEEEIKLVVVQREPVDVRDIADFIADALPRYMVPRYVEFVSEIPKTPTHKVQRFKMTTNTASTHDLKAKG